MDLWVILAGIYLGGCLHTLWEIFFHWDDIVQLGEEHNDGLITPAYIALITATVCVGMVFLWPLDLLWRGWKLVQSHFK